MLGNSPCQLSLKTLVPSERGSFVLTKLDEELIFAGETLSIRPPFPLKPFSNYTVTLSAGFVKSAKGDVIEEEYSYWFRTGAPRGSKVQLSIALGCYDEGECSGLEYSMQTFSDTPMSTLIDPLTEHIQQWRKKKTTQMLTSLAMKQEHAEEEAEEEAENSWFGGGVETTSTTTTTIVGIFLRWD